MQKHGINRRNLNENVSPKQDFYEYACGGWLEQNPMEDEFSSYGQFNALTETARKQVQQLILNLENDPASKIKGTIAQKISDLYKMGMDEERLNREGAAPVIPLIRKMKEMLGKDDFLGLMIWLYAGIESPFFSIGVGPDYADSNKNILHIGETGLMLGDRDYYLEDNENNLRILAAYEEYVKTVMKLVGYDDEEARRVWENVIRLERRIAEIKMKKEDRRNPELHYNIFTVDRLQKECDVIDWQKFFDGLGLKDVKEVNVGSVAYLRAIPALVKSLSTREIEDYLALSLASGASGLMSDAFIDANFELFGKVMSGQKEKKPRWKRAMGLPNSMFGEAVGALYVEKYFPKENKEYMVGLVENLRRSLDKHISSLEWMSQETREKAREKLAAMTVKIGYPDKWKEYEELVIDPEKTYLENVLEASKWVVQDNFSKLGKPVDKSEWHMYPQSVNAYYSPMVNEICFPAGILQPPFFDITADDALNYGAIGVVIGHEMTHAFDDSGRRFDKDGNLKDWWTQEDSEKFNRLADILVNQFNEVEVAPGTFANGKFTLGENIADQGGLNIALTAYKDTEGEKVTIDGFSPLQRFFLSYANVWAGHIREEEKIQRTVSDPHSLNKNRVNVTLKNIDEFEREFDINEGDPMYRPLEERVTIW